MALPKVNTPTNGVTLRTSSGREHVFSSIDAEVPKKRKHHGLFELNEGGRGNNNVSHTVCMSSYAAKKGIKMCVCERERKRAFPTVRLNTCYMPLLRSQARKSLPLPLLVRSSVPRLS